MPQINIEERVSQASQELEQQFLAKLDDLRKEAVDSSVSLFVWFAVMFASTTVTS